MQKKYQLKSDLPDNAFTVPYHEELNSSQWDVVRNADGPCLVLAGAGSGKTRTLVYRVSYLLEKGVRPEEILLVTFTNKAAHEMRSRVEILLKSKATGLWCGTFHHIANRLLRQYGRALGLENDFGILDEEDSRDLVKACIKSLDSANASIKLPKPAVIQNVISFSANTRRPIRQVVEKSFPHLMSFVDLIERSQRLYNDRKRKAKSLDYDDLLSFALDLLEKAPEVRSVLTQLFRYCLVDEYQDTNRIQHELVKALSSHHRNILVVGDDAQSIYSFRAATIRNILDFPKDYPDAKTYRLETNYRSTASILHLANYSIKQNREQFEKSLKSMREDGEKPQWARVRDARQEAAFICQKIADLRDEGVDASEIAVLFRAHYQAAELELEMAKRGFDYVVRGGVRFFEQAHVKDVLAYLRILGNPMDEIAWIRVLTLYPGIGSGYADRIFNKGVSSGGDLQKVCAPAFSSELPPRVRMGFEKFQALMKRLTVPEKHDSPETLLEEILEQGYSKHILLNFENARDRLEDIRQLVNFAHTYKTLRSFLTDTLLREGYKGETLEDQGRAGDKDALVLSTIHQAKGLEWQAVFVLGLSEGQFPHAKSMASQEELEEERRLFYVASTRAKDHLFFSQPMMRYDHQAGMVINRPSPFLLELESSLYDELEIEESTPTDTIYVEEDTHE